MLICDIVYRGPQALQIGASVSVGREHALESAIRWLLAQHALNLKTAFTMEHDPSSDRWRIHIMIFGHEQSDTFHWAITIGPKMEDGVKRGFMYHVLPVIDPGDDDVEEWRLEKKPTVSGNATPLSTARVTIGEILNRKELDTILDKVTMQQGNPDWRCRHWVVDAISAIAGAGIVDTPIDLGKWQAIEDEAKRFGRSKLNAGRSSKAEGRLPSKDVVPTYDMVTGTETVP